jgi:hypothetical protein
MESLTEELSAAIVIIGAEYCAIDSVRHETFHQLAQLGLACWNVGEWQLTAAGKKHLRGLLKCDQTELLSKNAA